MPLKVFFCLPLLFFLGAAALPAADPLGQQVDRLILEKAKEKPVSPKSDDGEFLRRVYLDFAGRIPSVAQTRAFLSDKSPDKRTKVVEQLLNGPDYRKRMADLFHVMLMERLGDNPQWRKYLAASFTENKPWDRMVREILRADPEDQASRGAAFFIAKRLDKVGQQTTDYPGLTRDIGRLFLGKNFQCNQCHDHLFIDEYKQQHFQGLFAFVQNVYIVDVNQPSVAEKPSTAKVSFMSVFKKINKETGPALPGGKETELPVFKKGEEYIKAPDPRNRIPGVPKFSTLALLSEQVPASDNQDFARNIANRLWFILMGRGLVHPLDLQHKDNPASHPEVLDLLARELVAHKFDMKWLLRELALTETYQRSSVLPKGVAKIEPETFLTAIEKKVSAEQLMWSMLEATGETNQLLARRQAGAIEPKSEPAAQSKPKAKAAAGGKNDPVEIVQTKFLKAFANPAREPEEEFNPSLRAALFILNDPTVLDWLTPRAGNLMDRLSKLTDDGKAAEELYLSVLTRLPSDEEKADVNKHLAKHKDNRPAALGQLAWALLASTEFSVNH